MLRIKNLSKSFKLAESRLHSVLNNINYSFPDKGLFFILGKSGSGKSTLMNILCGLLPIDEGEVFYNGQNIYKFTKKEKTNYLKNEIGILFQRFNLIEDLTLKENIDVAKWIKGIEEEEHLDNLLKKYKLDTKLNQVVSSLSGGERQRLSLIRALVSKPKILFCDEATGALDQENSKVLFDMLIELSKEMLVIMITHDIKLFNFYHDGYLLLEDGVIKEKLEVPTEEVKIEISSKKKRINDKFALKMAKKNIKKNLKRNLISTISSAFSGVVFILSIFLNKGIEANKDYLIETYGDKNAFKISLVKSEEIADSPISLTKNERPNHNEINTIFNEHKVLIDYSYDYFFHGEKKIECNTKIISDFTCKPFFETTLKENEVIINQDLANSIGSLKKGDFLILNLRQNYEYISEYSSKLISEDIELTINFLIGGVVEEFQYMNQPTLYYSSTYFQNILKNTSATNSSFDRNEFTSLYNLIDEAKNNSEISDYSLMIFSLSSDTSKIVRKMINNESKYDIQNFGFSMVNSFTSIASSIFLGTNIFIILTLITSLFVSGFLGYSSAILNRKESAILSFLGASDEEISRVYLYEQMIFIFLGILIGLFLSALFTLVINSLLTSFFINPSIISLDWVFIILIMICFFFISVFSTFLPLTLMKKRPIIEELKEE